MFVQPRVGRPRTQQRRYRAQVVAERVGIVRGHQVRLAHNDGHSWGLAIDDPEIAAIAKDCGAEVPFLRSQATSADDAMLYVVAQEVLKKKEKHYYI